MSDFKLIWLLLEEENLVPVSIYRCKEDFSLVAFIGVNLILKERNYKSNGV